MIDVKSNQGSGAINGFQIVEVPAVPALNGWSIAALSGTLLALGWLAIRRRQTAGG